MKLDVGCEFDYETGAPTPAIFVVRPSPANPPQTLLEEHWHAEPAAPYHDYVDLYGNECRRLTLASGRSRVRYDATVEVTDALDEANPGAKQASADALPDDVLMYTLPSRYCLSDVLGDRAWGLFAGTEPGWTRAQAICDFVHSHVEFGYGSSTPMTTAVEVFESRAGVCRDYAHLAIAFMRAMNIPARYVFGYLPDIDVAPPYPPMDFCAWLEAYLDGRWWTFDPRNNERRKGRVVIARGRDALDVAMVTTFGTAILHEMVVRADRSAA
jgi:transglutaminase-like putative cysteine protease